MTDATGIATAPIFTADATAGHDAGMATAADVDESATFTVTNTPVPVVSSPTITSGGSVAQGATTTVTVTGTGFAPGAKVTLTTPGITGGSATFVDGSHLSLPVTVAPNSLAPGTAVPPRGQVACAHHDG